MTRLNYATIAIASLGLGIFIGRYLGAKKTEELQQKRNAEYLKIHEGYLKMEALMDSLEVKVNNNCGKLP